MITNIYWLNKMNLKIKLKLKYLNSFNYLMAYSEIRKAMGGLSHMPVLFFIAGKFGIKT